MDQLHKRFTDEQIKVLFQGYCQGLLTRIAVQDMLGISKSWFFTLLTAYRQDVAAFSVAYHRTTPARLSAVVEAEIEQALRRDKELVEDERLPISGYNYSALRDRLAKKGIEVSLTTIIDRAKRLDCYMPHAKKSVHDREVLTAAIGALIQHDGSTHLWSPLAQEKWVLITSIDDFSRMLLCADFFPQESTWAHIQATQTLIQTYGLPLRYYVDSLRVFRFVQGRDSFWRKQVLETDDVDTQWCKMMRILGVDVIYALSPQAKEIPSIRFEQARAAGNSLFRPFSLPKPYTSPKDVFCLRETRRVNGYRRISLFNHTIEVPNVPLYEEVEIHLIPDMLKQIMDIRIWWNRKMVHSITYPLNEFTVHF